MTGPTGLLNYFVVEGTEYVDRLDALLRGADGGPPDAEAFTKAARALRGSATMAKLTGLSSLAGAVERVGRGVQERRVEWSPELRDALRSSVADLRELVGGARSWGDPHVRRAEERTAELLRFAPGAARPVTTPTPVSSSSGTLHVIEGCGDVAAALATAADRPFDPTLAADAVRRVRALRGVAALRDHPPLPEVLDAVERAARPSDGRGAPLGAAEAAVLAAGSRLLRQAAEDIRAGRPADATGAETRRFRDALGALELERAEALHIVPVESLYHADAGPHVLHAATAPATTAGDRFRLEGAAAGEHLRRLLADVRGADGTGAAAVAKAARALSDLVRSYGHAPLADAVVRATAGVESGDPIAVSAAEAVATLFVAQRRSADELTRRVGELAGGRAVGAMLTVGLAPLPPRGGTPAGGRLVDATPATGAAAIAPGMPAPPAPSPVPRPEREPEEGPEPIAVPTDEPGRVPQPQPDEPGEGQPTGDRLRQLLDEGIAGIARLSGETAAADGSAAAGPGLLAARRTPGDVVPIESLLYEGRSALGRALELRDEIRRGGSPPSAGQLDELFDLLDLAARG